MGHPVWLAGMACAVSVAVYHVVFFLNGVVARLWLLQNRGRLRRIKRLVPMQSYSFGIIVEGMDSIRRLWPEDECAVLAPRPVLGFRARDDVNRWLDQLEGRFNIFLLPSIQGLNIVRPLRLLTWPASAQKKFQSWLLPRLATALPETEVEAFWFVADRLLPAGKHLSVGNEHYGYHVGSALLRMRHPMPPVRLMTGARRKAGDAVRAAARPGAAKFANLYLRQKKTSDAQSGLRNGGPFEDYVPAIEILVQRGFTILINGDQVVPAALATRWPGQLLDARICGLDRGLFSLYAATEADISIGEPGGGFWLPTMNSIPSLMINAFPHYMGREFTTLLFKRATSLDGRALPPATLLRDRLYDHECTDLRIDCNTPEEIAAALEEFLEFLEARAPYEIPPGIEPLLPWDAFARICKSRYSPVWLNRAAQA